MCRMRCHQNSVIFIERGRILRNFGFKQITRNCTKKETKIMAFQGM
jgi:hypothetical protein